MTSTELSNLGDLIEKYCTEEWKYLLSEQTSESEYKKGDIIFQEGDKTDYISFVKSGKVKIFCCYTKDSQRIFRFATDGQIIGHRGLGEKNAFSVTALALTTTTTIDIPIRLFESILKANSLFCYFFMLFLAEELKQSERNMRDLINMDLRQRMANALKINLVAFGFDKKNSKKLAFTLSRKDLSHLAATTYESVIRTLRDFQSEGIIRLDKKEIEIENLEKLNEVINQNIEYISQRIQN